MTAPRHHSARSDDTSSDVDAGSIKRSFLRITDSWLGPTDGQGHVVSGEIVQISTRTVFRFRDTQPLTAFVMIPSTPMFAHFDIEDLLAQIADVPYSTFVIKDLQLRHVLVNTKFANAVGLPINEIVGKTDIEIGMPPRSVFGDPDREAEGFRQLDEAALASGESIRSYEPEIVYRSGDLPHSADTLRTPLQDRNGNVIGLLVRSRDTSHIEELERDLQQNRETIAARDGQLSIFDSVMAGMMARRQVGPLLQHIAKATVVCTTADAAYILMVHETGDYLEFVAGVGPEQEALLGQRRYPNDSMASKAWASNETVFVADTDNAPGMLQTGWPSGTQLCAVPLCSGGGVTGILLAASGAESQDLEPDIHHLEKLATLVSIAVDNAQSSEATAAELSRSRALSRLTESAPGFTVATEAYDAVCQAILEVLDADRASCLLIDEHGELRPKLSWSKGPSGPERASTLPIKVSDSIAGWCVRLREPAVVLRSEDDSRETPEVHEFYRKADVGGVACMPLSYKDKTVGALIVSRSRSRRDFSESEVNLFFTIVRQLCGMLDRLEMAQALHHQAFHDSLTLLPNRRKFEADLQQSLAQADAVEAEEALAVMFLDLDGFKTVNDTLGHSVGDELLKHVARRLSGRIKTQDVFARMGGDEFALLLVSIRKTADAIAVAERLREALVTPFNIDGVRLKIDTSIGLSFFPRDGLSGSELLRHADIAMYQAKKDGKGAIRCFDPTLATSSQNRARLELELSYAITNNEFRLHYQPQVSTTDGRVIGVEALVRWQHPTRGLLSPFFFIPVAEETGLIKEIGNWVLNEGVAQLAAWKGTPLADLRMSVNISAPQFLQSNFADRVLDTLERHDANPEKLELEVTESVVMNDIEVVVKRLETLREKGIRIAIDDFGTGYSSLSYLQDLPLDVLKIDRAFVIRLQEEDGQHSLVNTIMLLAQGLGLETIAEGVETDEQLDKIIALGCDLIQGYCYARPVDIDELADVIDTINTRQTPQAGARAA